MTAREEKILSEAGEFQRPTYGSATSRKSPMIEESNQNFDVGSTNINNDDLSQRRYFDRFSFCANFPRRYYLVLLAFFGFFNLYAMRVNLSVAILYMTSNRTIVYPDGSSTFIPSQFSDAVHSRGIVLSAFFYGYILTQLPGGYLACHYGGKIIYGSGIVVSGVLCLLIPLAVGLDYWALVVIRIVQGVFQGVAFPSFHALLSHWAPVQEKTIMATVAVAGCQFGTVVALPVSSSLADSFGWPAIFYFFGVLAIVWGFLWMFTIGETPYADKSIGKDELKYITSSVGYTFEQVKLLHDSLDENSSGNADAATDDVEYRVIRNNRFRSVMQAKNVTPPWKSILTSAPVWAIIASHFSENWGYYLMLTELPTYLSKVFAFTMTETGFLSALPYLVLGFAGPMAGFLADYLRVKRGVDTLLVRRMFNCIPLLLKAIFIGIVANVSSGSTALTFIVLYVGLGGFVWSAFAVNQLDISPQYAGVLMGLSNTVATIPGILGPPLVEILAPHNYASEWQLVFYIVVSLNIFGAAIYGAFSSADRQPWAEVPGGTVMTLDD